MAPGGFICGVCSVSSISSTSFYLLVVVLTSLLECPADPSAVTDTVYSWLFDVTRVTPVVDPIVDVILLSGSVILFSPFLFFLLFYSIFLVFCWAQFSGASYFCGVVLGRVVCFGIFC